MKTIYNTYVVMESQEQCDRMKKLCIDNGLPIWNNFEFIFDKNVGNQFYNTIDPTTNNFSYSFTVLYHSEHSTQITEQEFIELLNNK
jgi:hypothetical protein